MATDGVQLPLQPGPHQLRQGVTVVLLGGVPGGIAQLLFGALDGRREGTLRNSPHSPVHHISNLVGVGYHDFKGLFLGQIVELIEHILSGAIVQRRLIVRILEAVAGLQHRPVDRVLEMHVAGSHHRLVQHLAQLDDGAVEILNLVHGIHQMLAHHVFVIPQRLNLQKIVILCDLTQLFEALALHNSPVKFTSFTGRTNQKSVPILVQNAARNAGFLEEVVGVGLADDLVQVFQAHLIAH